MGSEEKNLPPGYRASLCVCVMDPFLYGLNQDSPVPERRLKKQSNKRKIFIFFRSRVCFQDGGCVGKTVKMPLWTFMAAVKVKTTGKINKC